VAYLPPPPPRYRTSVKISAPPTQALFYFLF
jgi:hypothetical protein